MKIGDRSNERKQENEESMEYNPKNSHRENSQVSTSAGKSPSVQEDVESAGAGEHDEEDDEGYDTDAIATAITTLRTRVDKRMKASLPGLSDALVRIESVEVGGKDFSEWTRCFISDGSRADEHTRRSIRHLLKAAVTLGKCDKLSSKAVSTHRFPIHDNKEVYSVLTTHTPFCPSRYSFAPQAKSFLKDDFDESQYRRLHNMISNFDRECVTDEVFGKLDKYVSGLDSARTHRKYGLIAGAIARWVCSVMDYARALRETAKYREEMQRLTKKLEDRYHEEDDYFDEVNDDDMFDENRYNQESGWA